MVRDDTKEEKKFEEEKAEVQIVTNEQLINFKLDQILEKLDSLKKQE